MTDLSSRIRPRRAWLLPLVAVVCLCTPGRAQDSTPTPPAPTPAVAPPPAFAYRSQIFQEVRRRFEAEDWAGLEALAREFRESRSRMANGHWKLPFLYSGLDPKGRAKTDADWQRCFAKLDAWRAAVPDSPTQPILRAQVLTSYAWHARGAGWASAVTEEGWRLFGERLAQARAALDAVPDSPGRCPHWAAAMQVVALGQGWGTGEYERLFAEAVRREPTYHEYYFRKAYRLLPRWFGRRGEWERFALEAAEKLDREEGLGLYARIAWEQENFQDNLFRDSDITWERMREGFRELLRLFPDASWNRNHFARFAVLAGDRETAREVINALVNRLDPEAWGGPGPIAVARAFVDPTTPNAQLTPAKRLGRPRNPAVYSLSFAPDGRTLAGGYADGQVVVWELPEGREVWRGTVSDDGDPVVNVAFSPDGTLLAACAAELIETNHPGSARVWETAGPRPEVDRITAFKGGVYRLAWTPDGRTLALTGGRYGKSGEGWFWDREPRALRPMSWPAEHEHEVHAVAFSPDGQTLVTDCNRSLTVRDLEGDRSRFDTRQSLPTWTQAVAFSPDGKTLAAAGSPGWEDRVTQPGSVIVFNTGTWKEQAAPRVAANTGGLLTLAYSPDGRWLAAGGIDQGVHVWDAATLQSRGIYVGHQAPVRGVAWSPDGRTLASASEDGAILLWEAPGE